MDIRIKTPSPCDTPDNHIIDLSRDGLGFIPCFADTHLRRFLKKAEKHRHKGFIEIMFCSRGNEIALTCENREFSFRPGDVVVAQPETRHVLTVNPKGFKYYWFWLKLTDRKRQFPHLSPAESKGLIRRLRTLPVHFFGGEPIRQAFQNVWKCHARASGDPLGKPRLRLAVYNLLFSLTDAATKPHHNDKPDSLKALLAEMRENPGRDWPVNDLARQLNSNLRKVNLLFKRATGLPPHAWLKELRIARAKERLAAHDVPVAAIARELGYASSQHFATQFRQETGVTPRAWRKKHPSKVKP